MRNYAKIAFTLAFSFVLLGLADAPEAHARLQYRKKADKMYKKLLEKQGTGEGDKRKLNCNVCHVAKKSKKIRNDYGAALAKILKKNEKDEDKIKAAFDKVYKQKSTKDKAKTYGELIDAGELPGTDKEAK